MKGNHRRHSDLQNKKTAQAALHTEPIAYSHGGASLEGYLAYDNAIQGKRPGVLVVHCFRGLRDFVKERTEQLAALGYIAFALDMYGVRPKDDGEAFTHLWREPSIDAQPRQRRPGDSQEARAHGRQALRCHGLLLWWWCRAGVSTQWG